jgi:hypothetical protein
MMFYLISARKVLGGGDRRGFHSRRSSRVQQVVL